MKQTGKILIGSLLLTAVLAAGATTTPAHPLALPAWRGLPVKADTPLAAPPATPFDPKKLAAEAGALVTATPAARFDLEARAADLAPGVAAALALVRDEIRFEAYPGVLRGAAGTYAARAGNAADLSLLLARLLERQGVPVRFALGRLAPEDAELLLARVFDGNPGAAPLADALVQRVATRARRDYGVVRTALGEGLPCPNANPRDEVLAELQAHVWVQAEVDGKWVDLDPSFSGAQPGRTWAEPSETLEQLAPEWYQKVIVRVIEERLSEDGLGETVALEVGMDAVDWNDAQVVLGHAPAATEGGVGALGPGGVGAGTDAWIPVLWIDGDRRAGEPVVFGTSQSSIGDIFGGGGGESMFVAEWLEVETILPGGRGDVSRRVLVDRGSAAWRASSPLEAEKLRPLARNAQGVKAVQALYNLWFNAGGHDVRRYAEALQVLGSALAVREEGAPATALSFDTQAAVLSLQNFSWLLASDEIVLAALNDSAGFRFYPDSPRISVFAAGLDLWAEADVPYMQTDLRRDHLRGLAREPGMEMELAERRLWFGVLEGALEHEYLAEQAVATGSTVDRVETTSSSLGKDGVVVLGGGFDSEAAQAHPETAARIRRALARGSLLVAPRRALAQEQGGWWEVASGSGEVRAVAGPDLGGGNFLPYYTNAAAPEFTYVIDEATGNVIGKIRLRPGLFRVPPRRGGNEYTLTVQITWQTGVAVAVAGGTTWFAYTRIARALGK